VNISSKLNSTARACEAAPGFPRAESKKYSHNDWNLSTTTESDSRPLVRL
jgi:hypothetical protein